MWWFVAGALWLVVLIFVVALCMAAARADRDIEDLWRRR